MMAQMGGIESAISSVWRSGALRWWALRLALLPVLFVVVSAASFWLLYGFLPDPTENPPIEIDPELLEQIRREHNLDRPVSERYLEWLGDALGGDLGTSWTTQEPVREMFVDALPPTVEFVCLALLVASVTGVGLGVWSTRGGRASRSAARVVEATTSSVPDFVALLLLIIVPSRLWDYSFPVEGYVSLADDPWDNLRTFVPTAFVVGAIASFAAARVVRSSLAANDGVAGEPPSRHWLLSVVAAPFATLPLVLAGVVVFEQLFAIQGLGDLLFYSTLVQDLPIAQCATVLFVMVALSARLFAPAQLHASDGAESDINLRLWLRRPVAIAALVLLGAFIALGALGPYVTPYDPFAIGEPGGRLAGPSFDHPFGTDRLDRDTLSRVLVGARVSLQFGLIVVFLGFVPGIAAGVALRRAGSLISITVRALCGLWLGLAILPMLLVFQVPFGLGLRPAAWVMGIFAFCYGLRMASFAFCDAPVWPLRDIPGITRRRMAASFCAGACDVFAAAVLAHTTLGFLGLGTSSADWGTQIAMSFNDAFDSWQFLYPSSALFLTLLGFRLLAGELRRDDVSPAAERIGAPEPFPEPRAVRDDGHAVI
jgi:ABC-type dipeptide/oligopeptide/nickel transport system permease component